MTAEEKSVIDKKVEEFQEAQGDYEFKRMSLKTSRVVLKAKKKRDLLAVELGQIMKDNDMVFPIRVYKTLESLGL